MKGILQISILVSILLLSISSVSAVNSDMSMQQETDCAKVCSYWPHAYHVAKEDPYNWKYDNLLYSRLPFYKENEECWCECLEGYKWKSITDEYGMIMIGNSVPILSCPRKFPPKRGGWTQGNGDGIMECIKFECPSHLVNVLDDPLCPPERRATRDCCCKEGYIYVAKNNSCEKVDESKFIYGRLYLEDSLERYPYGGVRYAKVKIKYEGKTYDTFTDYGGNFEVKVELKKGLTVDVTITLEDKESNVKVMDGLVDRANSVSFTKKQKVTSTDLKEGMDIEIYLDKKKEPKNIISSSDVKQVPGLVKEYMIFQDAWLFATGSLKAEVKPIKVITNDDTVKTSCDGYRACYWPRTQTIYLNTSFITFNSKDSPGIEFHEFGHHIMHCQFHPKYPAGTVSHKGFLNPDTSESLQEGEADFLALMVFETLLHNHPGLKTRKSGIMGSTNYEINYKPWQFDGPVQREEYAVSTLLWDLYDKKVDKVDTDYSFKSSAVDDVSLSIYEIWAVISQDSTNTVWDLYNALIKDNDKKDIDKLFLGHGFFIDMDKGDGKWNGPSTYHNVTDSAKLLQSETYGEIFDDINNNYVKDGTEKWQDLGHGHKFPGYPVYTKGVDTIGTAANFARESRKTKLDVPKSFVKVPNGEYLVQLFFEDETFNYEYITWANNEMLYLTFPPIEYGGEMIISPSPETYKSTGVFRVTNNEYRENMLKGNNYFAEHEFEMIPLENDSIFSGLDIIKKIGSLFLKVIIFLLLLFLLFGLVQRRRKGIRDSS